jgi:hypothetical protein
MRHRAESIGCFYQTRSQNKFSSRAKRCLFKKASLFRPKQTMRHRAESIGWFSIKLEARANSKVTRRFRPSSLGKQGDTELKACGVLAFWPSQKRASSYKYWDPTKIGCLCIGDDGMPMQPPREDQGSCRETVKPGDATRRRCTSQANMSKSCLRRSPPKRLPRLLCNSSGV